jgi:putative membrane protein
MARLTTRVLAGVGAFGLAVLVPVSAASAQSGDPVVTNTETVNATLTPSGEVDVVRIYDQTSVQGSGDVSFSNPVSTDGLRNLDSFGGFTVEDGSIVESTSVDGQFRQRSVSDFTKDLPVTVSVVYSLDGEEISPSDLVGKSGQVDVEYTITNVTCSSEEITVEGAGESEKKQGDVCDPLAGSLSFTLPSQYTDITSDTGFVTAGDGRGGTLMTLSITMISGLTEPEVVAGYSAQVENAVVPPASMSIVPVVVDANPSASAQKEALAGGADTGKTLAAGAGEIDANVLKLADGANTLVNGLLQLQDGGGQLSAGLIELNSNVPTLVSGVSQLNDGANKLEAGLKELQSKVPALSSGVGQLSTGADQLEAGLKELQSKLPALTAGVGQLVAGSQQLSGGLTALNAGLTNKFGPGLTQLSDGLQPAPAQALQLLNALKAVQAGTTTCLPSGNPQAPGCQEYMFGLIPQADTAQKQLTAAASGALELKTVFYAPLNTTDPSKSGVLATVGALNKGANDLTAGLQSLQSQLGPLVDGVNKLVAGATQLADGLDQLEANVGPLAAGVNQLTAGATQLSDGLTQLNDSTGPLASGVTQLTDGSVRLAAGLDSAAEAAPALPEGATRLSKEGTSQIVAAGKETAMSFGTRVALLEASAERTADGGLPYGAPEGALKAAAYRYDLNGASGAGTENMGQLVAGLAIAGGAAAGAGVLARRRSASA